jgi:hypothetical protein
LRKTPPNNKSKKKKFKRSNIIAWNLFSLFSLEEEEFSIQEILEIYLKKQSSLNNIFSLVAKCCVCFLLFYFEKV